MNLQDYITLSITFLTLFIYFVYGARRKAEVTKIDDFFFYNRKLDQFGYTKTFVATSISLATVLFFFLDYGGIFGLGLIFSPIFYALGTWIFIKILPILKEKKFLEKGTTLHNFLGTTYGNSSIRYSTAIISILGYLGIFVIELYVGVTIFGLFSATTQWTAIVAIFLMLLIMIYTYLGGFRAVIDTDKIQLFLIGTGTIFGLFTLIFLATTQEPVHKLDFIPLEFPFLPLSFFIVMLIGNVPFQILRMSHWQRAASVSDIGLIRSGLYKGIFQSFGWWVLFLLMGVLLYHIASFSISNSEQNRLGALVFLDLLRNGNQLYSYFVYPLIFTGFVAALISTADTIFITILTSYIYDFKYHSKLHNNGEYSSPSDEIQMQALKDARKGIVIFTALAGILYYLLVHVFNFQFVDLLFVFFTQQLALFPTVIVALKSKENIAYKLKIPALVSMWIGWASIWVISLVGKYNDLPDLTLYASALGWLLSILIFFVFAPKKVFSLFRRS